MKGEGVTIAVFPGDGIGPEVVAEAVKILGVIEGARRVSFRLDYGPVGGAALDACGEPLPASSLKKALEARAVLLGAVGGPKWDGLDYALRPERALLGLRERLGLFANLRPVTVYEELIDASPLKGEVVRGTDILIVRELTGDLYFGTPRGIRTEGGRRVGVNTLIYTEEEIRRIAQVAFLAARRRRRRVTSVDKANVLESTQLWRDVVTETAASYPDVELDHMYVDNCAMQLVRDPRRFDVVLTTNMFGDILSDEGAMITGSIGMLPSASLGETHAMYEPIHGSAPDIAGRGTANPLAAILSVAMMCRHTLGWEEEARAVEGAVRRVLRDGLRTADLARPGERTVGTAEMGDAVAAALAASLGG
ncbi:MAG TPA: 3-isopropylmalate dehydrogenase [Syntrophales bacterium]|nr:3-isopropylmalate dehydrogenase [Syntrophales bacterium]HOM06105.1 3-isopropylmalate dehydrogenase [Syntrophales bacterium]HON99031.1 3-isopropylmalate dehydrogenase [Syntrophales bacterium]HPC00505.1 3-isopropylmalate dehydrogenase [Syntrophales bacterium]HPQ05588.1 3-isopropylmalate dehydrogenase [Syntrophales bacterium]